jgi:prepilin-type processing-associated H-X9-DG protein
MENKKGLALLEVVVVIILILVMLLMVLLPARGRVGPLGKRLVCGTNVKGFGWAFSIYASDNDDLVPQLPGEGPWGKELGFSYDMAEPDFTGAQANTPRTITASWYLLVREVDMGPKSFLCPESDEIEFKIDVPRDTTYFDIWDFGSDPYKHISYAMHNPYGKYPANKNKPSEFAVAADMNPWINGGDLIEANINKDLPPQIINLQDKETRTKGNSLNHTGYESKVLRHIKHSPTGFGQNVLYADGHAEFKRSPNCGAKKDNIYTYWSNEENPTEQDIQGGTAPADRNPETDAKSEEDSFLVL